MHFHYNILKNYFYFLLEGCNNYIYLFIMRAVVHVTWLVTRGYNNVLY